MNKKAQIGGSNAFTGAIWTIGMVIVIVFVVALIVAVLAGFLQTQADEADADSYAQNITELGLKTGYDAFAKVPQVVAIIIIGLVIGILMMVVGYFMGGKGR